MKNSLSLFLPKPVLVTTILILVYGVSAFGQGITFNKKDWETVLKESKKTQKPIFLDAYTTWCGPCKKMDKRVFKNQTVGEFYNTNFINIKMDMEKGIGIQLAKKYRIRAYPTFLYLDEKGEILHKVAGYHNEEKFIAVGRKALNPQFRLGELDRYYNVGVRKPKFLYKYAYAKKLASDKTHRVIVKEYLDTQNDWSTPENLQFIYDFAESTRSRHFNYMLDNKQLFVEKFSEATMDGRIQKLVNGRLDFIMNQKGDVAREFTDAYKLFGKVYGEDATGRFAGFKMTYYRSQGNTDGFAKAAIEYVENMRGITADELNSISRTFVEVIDDGAMLEKAVVWQKKAIKMDNSYSHYYTLAALYAKMSNKKKAKKAAKKALKIGKKTKEDTSAVKQLMSDIKNIKKKKK